MSFKGKLLLLKKFGDDIYTAFFKSEDYTFDDRIFSSEWAYPVNYEIFLNKNKIKIYYPYFDSNGIPVGLYPNSGFQYNPTRIAGYSFANFSKAYFSKSKQHLEIFLKTAEWFKSHSNGRFIYKFDLPPLKAPWISGMAQGQGISVLLRAYILTNDKAFLDIAVKAAEPLKKTIEEEGTIAFINGNLPIIEEFPTEKPDHVLNGFIFALVGINELRRVVPEAFPEKLFMDLVKTASMGELWTFKDWSVYDLIGLGTNIRNASTVRYHNLHIALYKYLDFYYPQFGFKKWIDIWEKSLNSLPKRLEALKNKIIFRLKHPAVRA